MTQIVKNIMSHNIPNLSVSRDWRKVSRQWHTVNCNHCGESFKMQNWKIKQFKVSNGGGLECYDCYIKGKEELKQAMIAIAKRKAK